jgi:hypothetical protein
MVSIHISSMVAGEGCLQEVSQTKTKPMKYIVSLLLSIVGIQVVTAAETTKTTTTTTTTKVAVVEAKKPIGIEASLEPYGTVAWAGLNGQSDLGAGAAVVLPLGFRGLSLVGFGEGDNKEGLLVERLGAGLRYTAYIGKVISLDGGVAGGYDLEDPHLFIRLPLGANFTFIRTKNLDVSLRVQYAFDVSGGHGSSGRQRSGGVSELDGSCNDNPKPAAISTSGNERSAIGRLFAGPVVNFKF